MLLLFLISFGQVFLVAWNSRNTVQSRFIGAFFVSLVITVLQVLNTKMLWHSNFSLPAIIATGLGGALGVSLGGYFHKKLVSKKNPNEW